MYYGDVAIRYISPMINDNATRFATELRATYGEDLTPIYKIISSLAFAALEKGVEPEEVARVRPILMMME